MKKRMTAPEGLRTEMTAMEYASDGAEDLVIGAEDRHFYFAPVRQRAAASD